MKELLIRIAAFAALVALCSSVPRPAEAAASAPPIPRLGINLAGPADWNTELPFVDVFRLSRTWISQTKGASWGKGPDLSLDAQGWVTKLEPDCWAETLMCTIDGGHYPNGEYTVLYDGDGKLEFWGSATKVVLRTPGRMVVEVNSSKGALFLRLLETNPANRVRNIRIIMPGFEMTHQAQPWHPAFLKRWRGVAGLRFMDFQETNNSHQRSWADRPKPDDATFTKRGIPVEWMVDLANRLGAAPWFCLPHQADDEYVRQFAQVVKERLDPSLRVYVEYSNEVWNGIFSQHRYAGEQGQKLGFAEKPWEAAWRYTAHRSVQIFGIWENVFGGTQRLVRVLPSQAANSHISDVVASWQDAYKHADALAIAPYVSCNISRDGKRLNAATAEKWTVDEALDYLENIALPESVRWVQANKKIADKYGLKLIAYEAGQHMVGVGGVENNDAIMKLLHSANAHPRMAGIYRKYYDAWVREGGDLLCHFSSVGRWSKWGSWGLLQFADDDPKQSPKFGATMQWAKELGQQVSMP